MTAREQKRADMRVQFPQLADLVDGMRAAGFEPRVTCITDHDGNVLAGKLPEPDPRTFEVSVETVEAARALALHVGRMAGKPWPRQQR